MVHNPYPACRKDSGGPQDWRVKFATGRGTYVLRKTAASSKTWQVRVTDRRFLKWEPNNVWSRYWSYSNIERQTRYFSQVEGLQTRNVTPKSFRSGKQSSMEPQEDDGLQKLAGTGDILAGLHMVTSRLWCLWVVSQPWLSMFLSSVDVSESSGVKSDKVAGKWSGFEKLYCNKQQVKS